MRGMILIILFLLVPSIALSKDAYPTGYSSDTTYGKGEEGILSGNFKPQPVGDTGTLKKKDHQGEEQNDPGFFDKMAQKGKEFFIPEVRQIQEIAVIQTEGAFVPAKIFLHVGVPVRLYVTNAIKRELAFVSDKLNIQKGVTFGQISEIDFVPEKEGMYKFYCPINGAEGVFVVR